MKVREFIKKWDIDEEQMRIYIESIDDEVYGSSMKAYYDEEVLNAYEHNGDTVLQVKGA